MNSISDRSSYRDICLSAYRDSDVFDSFKRHPSYNWVLEHVSREEGQLYLEIIKRNLPEFEEKKDIFKFNDVLGNPFVFEYDGQFFSPTTLRYVKVLSDIKNLFGDISGKSVVEIGSGYGGQCFITQQLFDIDEYTLVDIEEPLMLASKYLDTLNSIAKKKVNYKTLSVEEVVTSTKKFDIVIANYSYSELSIELQDLYYERFIKHSTNGYFTVNFVSSDFGIRSYSMEQIIEKFSVKNPKILEETPLTFKNNKIIYF